MACKKSRRRWRRAEKETVSERLLLLDTFVKFFSTKSSTDPRRPFAHLDGMYVSENARDRIDGRLVLVQDYRYEQDRSLYY